MRYARFLLWTVIGLSWAWITFVCDLNHDVAGVLHFADRLLGGERLYEDMADVNPPLAFLLAVPPAALSRLTDISMHIAWGIYATLLFGGSLYAIRLALRLSRVSSPEWLLIAAATSLGPGAAGMVGQREHLMLILTLPWIIGCVARLKGVRDPRAEIVFAVAAAVGMCLKPPFLLVGIGVELYVMASLKPKAWIREPSPYVMLAVGLAYTAVVLAEFRTYLTRIVPWLIGPYEELGHIGVVDILTDSRAAVSLTACLLLLALWRRSASLGHALLISAAAGALSAVVQGKGWPYHYLPLVTFAAMGLATMVLTQWQRRGTGLIAIFCALACCLPIQERSGWIPRPVGDPTTQLEAFLDREKGRVLVVSPMLSPLFPGLLEMPGRDVTPAMTAWQVQTAQACPGEPPPTASEHEASDWFRDHVATAIEGGVEVILVDPVPLRPDCVGADDFPHWLRADRKLAPLIARYRPVGTIWRLQVWRRS